MSYADIAAERQRQHAKWGDQSNLPDGTGPQWADDADTARRLCDLAMRGGYVKWRHILREEVAEAFAESDPDRLRAELVQVAAVCVQWIEAIDRRAES